MADFRLPLARDCVENMQYGFLLAPDGKGWYADECHDLTARAIVKTEFPSNYPSLLKESAAGNPGCFMNFLLEEKKYIRGGIILCPGRNDFWERLDSVFINIDETDQNDIKLLRSFVVGLPLTTKVVMHKAEMTAADILRKMKEAKHG